MNSRILPSREPQYLFLLSLFAFLELFISGVVTLLISPDPKSALIFGFSALRLLLVAAIWILAIVVLVAGIISRRRKLSLDSAWLVYRSRSLRQSIYAISFALIVWGWLSLFCPAYLFGRLIYIFERVRPFSIALGAALAQSWLFYLYARGRLGFRVPARSAFQKYFRPTLLFAVVITGLGIFIASTKFGLLANVIYANVPGIPLSSLQWFFILLLAGFWIALVPNQQRELPFFKIVKRYRLIPILIFISAVLAWGLTPMLGHFFSLPPAAPGYQPFPYSDARLYDLAGISILRGYGISVYGLPLYSIFLAILHFFAGSNYTIMTWLQILVLAFIPVILYFLGEKFHSSAFGIFLSIILILRQRNAIVLSYRVSSINPKLFMTEEMTLLGVILFAYLVFLWMRDRKIWQALLCGGCIGATSLLRLNPTFLFPAIACLAVPVFWGKGKKFLLIHLSTYTLAFLILLIPWILSTVDTQGTPWLFIKLYNVIKQRYGSIDSSVQGYVGSSLPEMGLAAVNLDGYAFPILQSHGLQEWAINDSARAKPSQETGSVFLQGSIESNGIVSRFLDHLLHNFSTSILSMPDSLIYDDLNHLSQRIYWVDGGGWQGNLPLAQAGMVFLNLVLVAIGLGYSWAHHRWAGMIPMTIFIAYSLSLSAAMNSGGRYLTPMDWVIYFYYGLAIVVIIKFVIKALTGKDNSQPAGLVSVEKPLISDRRKLVWSLVGVVCLAGLIPIAKWVLPVVTASARNHANVEAARQEISTNEKTGAIVVYGEILYPYYEERMLTFDFLTPSGSTSYAILRNPALKTELSGGEQAFIALLGDDQKNLPVESIYLWQDAKPVLFWKNKP
jgi:hypothetical protein